MASSTDAPPYADPNPDVDGSEWVEVSKHVYSRWRQRHTSTDPKIGPRVAWFEAVEVPPPHGLHADEVRFHDSTRTLLLRKASHLVTVIGLDDAKPAARQAVGRILMAER